MVDHTAFRSVRGGRATIAAGMRGLVRLEIAAEDVCWPRVVALQAGARTLSWVNWWDLRSHVVSDANEMTRLSRRQRTLDGQPDLIDLLRERLEKEGYRG